MELQNVTFIANDITASEGDEDTSSTNLMTLPLSTCTHILHSSVSMFYY